MLRKSYVPKGRTCFLPIQLSSMCADLIILSQTSSRLRSDHAFSAVTTKNTNINEDIFIRRGGGRAVTWWLRYYATNRQVAGSIPDGFTGNCQ